MKIIEFRIVVPTKLENYNIGNRYMNLEYIREEKGGGEGIEIVKNEPFVNGNEKGQYTYKIFHVKSKLPGFIRWAVPDKYLHFHEESWNSYPHYVTKNRVPGMGKDFILDVESRHIEYKNGMNIPDNAIGLTEKELEIRKVVYLDIVDGEPEPEKPEHIMEGFVCPEAGIDTPLKGKKGSYKSSKIPRWTKKYDGDMIMCIKVVKFHFKWWGLQSAVEKFLMKTVYPKIFTESHRKIIASSGKWFNLTMDEITRMENQAHEDQREDDDFERDED